jgi:hypothetical protein
MYLIAFPKYMRFLPIKPQESWKKIKNEIGRGKKKICAYC